MTTEHLTLGPGVIGHIWRQRTADPGTYALADRWFHYDQVGSVLSESGTAGTLAQRHEQDAFGNTVASWQSYTWGGDQPGWHHNSKEFDGDLGLVYMYLRWYDGKLGAFMSESPLHAAQEERFASFSSDPIAFADSVGLKRHHFDDGWSADPGLKKGAVNEPDPKNPEHWDERPHVNTPSGDKIYPGGTLPKKTPQKVKDWVDKKGWGISCSRIADPPHLWEVRMEDFNPKENPRIVIYPVVLAGTAGAIAGAPAAIAAGGAVVRAASAAFPRVVSVALPI